MSTRRIIVEAPVADEFVQKLVKKVSSFKVGDPKEPDTIIGPLINRHQLGKVRNSVEAAVRDGAKDLCGGKTEGPCYHPTVFTNVKAGTSFSCEETFGPVLSVIEVDSVETHRGHKNDTSVRTFGSRLHARPRKGHGRCRQDRIGNSPHQ